MAMIRAALDGRGVILVFAEFAEFVGTGHEQHVFLSCSKPNVTYEALIGWSLLLVLIGPECVVL